MPTNPTRRTTIVAQAFALGADVVTCLRFFSRLPLPPFAFERDGIGILAEAVRVLPVAGLILGAIGAAVLAVGAGLGLPDAACAALALAALAMATGALHEDGLADTADGFGGGATRDRKLAIMRDSHIGSYGVLALVFGTLLRVIGLATLLDRAGPVGAACALMAASAVSRGLSILPMTILAAARPDGLGRSVGRPAASVSRICFVLVAAIGVALPIAGGLDGRSALIACGMAAVAALGMTRLAFRQIGGHTGDVAGATQQVSEIAFFVGLLIVIHA
ncbi:adenosylcobinamide-GDP ribazoletransferase [Lichenihabitans sp. PAMC28606]|uniref:adenosylcobinamide-GDP ribazoletransferase n=1 Tax=Lichenihabitans sp. PAMC28606 TaxID=2880932 RepID=UPI001D0A154A|nr:adenosylcobinamide-GDP ribazoletransferase [Lichenihabitans sp. PAMC28606]UDL95567.1 adenosylcobinamide-GDP ribazoletransferase [Lichenihabitans sp. PAMC28606]